MSLTSQLMAALVQLERMDVITTDPGDVLCCGLERDDDGRCSSNGRHPVYVELDQLPAVEAVRRWAPEPMAPAACDAVSGTGRICARGAGHPGDHMEGGWCWSGSSSVIGAFQRERRQVIE